MSRETGAKVDQDRNREPYKDSAALARRVTEGIYESSKQVTKSPKNGSKIEFSPPRRLLVKRRRSVPHEVPVLTDATFKVNFFWTPFSPSSSIHLETKQRLLLGHVNSWHINIPVLVVGVSPECRVPRVRAADVFARGFSSGSDKHAIRFWNLSIRILRLTRRNKTCGGDFPVLSVFLVTTCSTTSRVGISE
ncbi:hypothetical protein K438DRAFT_1781289 [Mycena galopus ATCC 62051]|nr:hypothetical protein K438DRAFT_1781289 [Mycena galopus ATCC 62051]